MESKTENKKAIEEMGKFLCQKRTAMGITLREAAELLDVSHQFLNDVERGKKMFPIKRDFQKRSETIRKIYSLNTLEYYKFLDLIGEARNDIPPDVKAYIMGDGLSDDSNTIVAETIRKAMYLGAGEKDWKQFENYLKEMYETIFSKIKDPVIKSHSIENTSEWQNLKDEKMSGFVLYDIYCDKENIETVFSYFESDYKFEDKNPEEDIVQIFHIAQFADGHERVFLDEGELWREIKFNNNELVEYKNLKASYANTLGIAPDRLDRTLMRRGRLEDPRMI